MTAFSGSATPPSWLGAMVSQAGATVRRSGPGETSLADARRPACSREPHCRATSIRSCCVAGFPVVGAARVAGRRRGRQAPAVDGGGAAGHVFNLGHGRAAQHRSGGDQPTQWHWCIAL